jgi:hypothetical protein
MGVKKKEGEENKRSELKKGLGKDENAPLRDVMWGRPDHANDACMVHAM